METHINKNCLKVANFWIVKFERKTQPWQEEARKVSLVCGGGKGSGTRSNQVNAHSRKLAVYSKFSSNTTHTHLTIITFQAASAYLYHLFISHTCRLLSVLHFNYLIRSSPVHKPLIFQFLSPLSSLLSSSSRSILTRPTIISYFLSVKWFALFPALSLRQLHRARLVCSKHIFICK